MGRKCAGDEGEKIPIEVVVEAELERLVLIEVKDDRVERLPNEFNVRVLWANCEILKLFAVLVKVDSGVKEFYLDFSRELNGLILGILREDSFKATVKFNLFSLKVFIEFQL